MFDININTEGYCLGRIYTDCAVCGNRLKGEFYPENTTILIEPCLICLRKAAKEVSVGYEEH